MYAATEKISQYFDEQEITYRVIERENASVLVAGVNSEKTSFEILYISHDDENDVAMRVYDFIKFEDEKYADLLELVNQLNHRYRYVKFILDTNDNTVNIEIDFPSSTSNVGELAFEMLIRCTKIIDGAYPDFMRCIWT